MWSTSPQESVHIHGQPRQPEKRAEKDDDDESAARMLEVFQADRLAALLPGMICAGHWSFKQFRAGLAQGYMPTDRGNRGFYSKSPPSATRHQVPSGRPGSEIVVLHAWARETVFHAGFCATLVRVPIQSGLLAGNPSKMRVLVTGATGLLGQALVEVFREKHEVIPLAHADADITHETEVHAAFARAEPAIVLHTVAIRDPDECELEPAKAFLVNVEGTWNVAEAARQAGAAMVYISTDAVFDGCKQTPYMEADATNPPTVYGRTKLLAEEIVRGLPGHWIFRVSILFGPGKINFVQKGLRQIAAGQEYVVPYDQLGSATYTPDAARKILEVVEARRFGLFHLANAGACSRLELARRAAELAGLNPEKVVGKSLDELKRPAKRLKYSVMEMAALRQAGFALPRPWPDALSEYLQASKAIS
jgi:dTDP-4-dehydrorhamnose reductase